MPKPPNGLPMPLRRALTVLLWLLAGALAQPARAEAPLSLGRFSAATLEGHALHTVYDDGARIWLLASTLVEPATFYRNPDGGKAYLRQLHLVRIGTNAEVTRVTLGQVANGDAYPSVGALLVTGTTVVAFQNSVQYSSLGAFGLEGFLYTVDGNTLATAGAQRLFSNANWGWHPVLYPGPLLSHFSYAGYRRYLDTDDQGDASPATLMAEYDTSVAAQSRGLVLAHEAQQLQRYAPTVLARIAARLAAAPPAPEPVVLPALPAQNLPLPTRPGLGSRPALRMAASGTHALAVDDRGTLMAWGDDHWGQLGLSRLVQALQPTRVNASTPFSQVAAGHDHTLALGTDGTLWAWGANEHGQLGDGTGIHRASPVPLAGRWVAVAAGGQHSLALQADGSLWAWGRNAEGQLGDGTQTGRFVPTRIGTGFAGLAAGEAHSLALGVDGRVWAWGNNHFGQAGVAPLSVRDELFYPEWVGGGFVAMAAGAWHSLGLKSDGSLWAWGQNQWGQLGNGRPNAGAAVATPTRIGTGFVAVAAGAQHSLALRSDGSLWAWGDNRSGQLGERGSAQRNVPTRVGAGFVGLAAGGSQSLATRADGTVWSWGANDAGQLGDGTFSDHDTPALAINPALDGFLDLDLATPNSLPAGSAPPFLAKASRTGELSSLSLSVDVHGLLSAATPTARTASTAGAGAYNIYVAAQAGALGWFQLDASRNWAALSWPMSSFMRGVALASNLDTATVDIFSGLDVSALGGHASMWALAPTRRKCWAQDATAR